MSWYSNPRPRLSCRAVARLLQAYLDGELADPRAVLVADHLDECRRCGLEAETWQWLKGAVAGLRPAHDPEQIDHLRAFVDELVEPQA
jgi:anti-sigma factor RsiW